MSVIDKIIDSVEFEPDCMNKWDFDGDILVIRSRGYNREKKSFYVGYYLRNLPQDRYGINDDLIPIIEDELFDEDFDRLKSKVREWYKKNFNTALDVLKKLV